MKSQEMIRIIEHKKVRRMRSQIVAMQFDTNKKELHKETLLINLFNLPNHGSDYTANEVPHPQVLDAFGF
jgi:hypothetical protein